MKFSNEIELMIACARSDADQIVVEQLAKKAGLDWDMFIKTCTRHKVLPLVFNSLLTCGSGLVPETVKSRVDAYLFENSIHNYDLLEQLFFILDLLKQNGIKAVPFKGPVLAQVLFGDITFRRYLDLDIFISKEDAKKAVGVLFECGFEPEEILPEGSIDGGYLDKLAGLSLVWKKKQLSVDLQWDIANRFTTIPMALERVENRLEQVDIENRSIPSLPTEELLCYLCVHGIKHRWQILDGACCVAELIKVREDIDWEYTLAYAGKMHCKKVLYLGLCLARDLLDARLPDFVDQEINKNRDIEVLAIEACRCMFTDYMETRTFSEKFDYFLFKAKDRVIDKIRYCGVLLFVPTKRDLKVFQVRESLSFLLYVLRPLRLIFEYGRRIKR